MTNKTQQAPAIVISSPQGAGGSVGQIIRIQEVLHVLLKRRAWILVCIIFGIVFGLCLSVVSYIKSQTIRQYAIESSIALASQDTEGLFSKASKDPDSTDFHLAEDMVDAAEFILMSDSSLNAVIEEINLLGVSARDIKNSLRMEQYKETQIIQIYLYWGNASEGVEILEAMNRLAPTLLIRTLKLGSVTVINDPTARFVIGGNLNLTRNLILGVILGFAMGAALAVLDLLLHPTLLTVQDVELRLELPLLGTISENYEETPIQKELLQPEDNVTMRTEMADSYLAAAYSLKRHLGSQQHPCVMITSADRSEGRTVTTACLAAALSRVGLKVLAVDLDFQNPTLAGMFFRDVDPQRSINALYLGKILPKDAVMSVNGTLDILPALLERDAISLNGAALDLIGRLREDYDIILLDTPPVGQIADTMALNVVTEQALFVIQHDGMTQAALQEALTRLSSVEIQVIGAVVNRVNRKRGDYRDRKRKKLPPLERIISKVKSKLPKPKAPKLPKLPKKKK